MQMDEKTRKTFETLAEAALNEAFKAGADDAEAIVTGGESIDVEVREGALEHLERSDGASLGLRVMVGSRQAVVSLGDPARADLAEAAARAVAMAKVTPEDPFLATADPDDLARDWPDLDLSDAVDPGEAELQDMALACEEAALSIEGVTKSAGASASAARSFVCLALGNGFRGAYERTSRSIAVSVIAGQGADMQRDYEYDSRPHLEDLRAPQEVGREAAERAVRRLHPRKVPSLADVPVIFEQRLAGSIAGHLASAVNGQSIARGSSFLKEKMDTPILPEGVDVIDDARMPRGLASKPFDGEGLPTGRLKVVEGGVLRAWLLDLATARQLGLRSNAHAARSIAAPPSPASTNFHIAAGKVSPQDLISGIGRGLLVTELIGFGVNPVTGDYSRGASGFWIENGRIDHPVSEVTIAGNLLDMFARLTPADDLVFRSATCAPTLLVEGMTIAGK